MQGLLRYAENAGMTAKKAVDKAVPYLDPTNPVYDKIPVLKQTRELSRSLGYDPAMDNSIPFKERLPMYLQKYGEGFMGSHGGLGKAPSKGILPNPIAKRAFQLANEMDAKGNISIEQTDEVMQMVKDYLKLPEKQAAKMTIPQMLQELTGNADNDQMAAFYKVPQRSKQPNVAKQSFYDTGKKVYHVSNSGHNDFRLPTKDNGMGQAKAVFFSETPDGTKYYQRSKSAKVLEATIKPEAKIWDYRKPEDIKLLHEYVDKTVTDNPAWNKSFKNLINSGDWGTIERPEVQQYLKKAGFDGFVNKDMTGHDAIGITNLKMINRPQSHVAQESLPNQSFYDTTNIDDFLANKLNGSKFTYPSESGMATSKALKIGDNNIRYQVFDQDNQILMPKIYIDKKNTGLGSQFMETMKEYADSKGKPLVINNVENPKFFDKFPWLKYEKGAYRYSPARVAQESLGDIKDFDIPNLGQSILNVLNKNK